jgi:hypothetical protein
MEFPYFDLLHSDSEGGQRPPAADFFVSFIGISIRNLQILVAKCE